MKRSFWRLAGIALILLAIGAGFLYWYGFMRKETPMEKLNPDFEISADSLFSVFNAGEQEATLKFGGKILLLKAEIVSVDHDSRGNVTLVLVDPMMGVTCTIDSLQAVKQKSVIESLTEGVPVTVKGRCDGMLTDVKISKCIIVK